MKERPILFTGPMVRAILAGRKTQTRRLVKLPKVGRIDVARDGTPVYTSGAPDDGGNPIRCPYGVPGDRLWVRETWQAWRCVATETDEWEPITKETRGALTLKEWFAEHGEPGPHTVEHRASGKSTGPWTPSIFMPRWASRITLVVESVRVERLHAITEEDARAEGVEGRTLETWSAYDPETGGYPEFMVEPARSGLENIRHHVRTILTARQAFAQLWDSINAKRAPWESNPWVWVVGFRRKT